MEGKELLEGPVALEVFIYWKRPGKHYIGNLESKTSKARKAVKPGTPWIPETRPDTTKLFRAVEDALLKIVFNDDSQVSRILVEKIYADDWFVDVRCYELEPYPHD
jgi:Holliday junction resolvase RusA-like endonuclease